MQVFELSEEDVATVLRQNQHRIRDPQGRTIADLAAHLFDELDGGAVERAALAGASEVGTYSGAYAEIAQQLVDRGFLALPASPASRRPRP